MLPLNALFEIAVVIMLGIALSKLNAIEAKLTGTKSALDNSAKTI